MVTDYMEMLEKRNEELSEINTGLAAENERLQCPEVMIMLEHPKARVPTRGSEGAAGYDLYAIERVDIPPGRQAKLPTGVIFAIPSGWYGRVAPRSGLAVKHGISVHAGVVDSDFRGPVAVCLFNHGDDVLEIRPGDRIAQMIIERCSTAPLTVVDYVPSTDRGHGSFGSTGMR